MKSSTFKSTQFQTTSKMNYSFLFLLPYYMLQTADCIMFRKWTRWNETNITFGTSLGSMESVPLMMCLLKCQETSGCVTANVNEAHSKCEFSSYYPPDGTVLATSLTGWNVYYIGMIQFYYYCLIKF